MAYSPDTKAAVLAELMLGASPSEVETLYGVSRRTARRWRDAYIAELAENAHKKEKDAKDLASLSLRTALRGSYGQ